jgi:hypothetical protein
MKFQDIFVPRWQNSNPETRIKAVMRLNDKKLLSQIVEMDEDDRVRSTAREKLAELKAEGKKVTA